jgi:hypothetical protein
LSTGDLDQIDPLLYPKEDYHVSYLPTKYEIHLSINKGCMGKSVKSILSTGDLDPTDPLLNQKDEYHASYLPTKYKIYLSLDKGCMSKCVKIYF